MNLNVEDARATEVGGCWLRGTRENGGGPVHLSPSWRVPDDSITREGNVPFNSAYTILGLFLSRATRTFLRRRQPVGQPTGRGRRR